MFAYCLNNPVNGKDTDGFRGIFDGLKQVVDGIKERLGIGDFDDLSLEEEDNSVKNVNFSSIKDPFAIYIYSIYVNHFSEYKDVVKGTSVGLAYEWCLHNLAYDASKCAEFFGYNTNDFQKKVKDVNVEATIFSDNHPPFSFFMDATYRSTCPITAFVDEIIAVFGGS